MLECVSTSTVTGARGIVAVAVAASLAFLAAPAWGAPGSPLLGPNGTEKDTGEWLKSNGLFGAEVLPHLPLETTAFTVCPAEGRCTAGPFHVNGGISTGLVPVYEGTVTLKIRGPGGSERPLVTCTMPGFCPLLATGGTAQGTITIIGEAAAGSVGSYVLWVTYE